MGIVFGRFFGKKPNTLEALEKLENEIKTIENYRRDTEVYQKKIVGRFVILSVLIYLLTAFLFYFYFFSASLYERLFYIIPLILAPVIIISVKRILTWYYNRKIRVKQMRLKNLKDEKQKLLDKVMETETYKTAKTILEKYAPEPTANLRKPVSASDLTPYKPISTVSSSELTPGLRQRTFQQSSQPSRTSFSGLTPGASLRPVTYPNSLRTKSSVTSMTTVTGGTPLPLPRAILPRERSVLDKMVDYLVGDGPSNRYALICQECSSHNGMAVREEFEYISFRCCYCFHLNPARKKRPTAPQLETDGPKVPRFQRLSTSDNESDSDHSDVAKHKRKATEVDGSVRSEESSKVEDGEGVEVEEEDVGNKEAEWETNEEEVVPDMIGTSTKED